MATLFCDGNIIEKSSVKVICSVDWVYVPTYTPLDPALLDPALMSAFFGAGFLMLLPVWAVIFGLKALLKALS